MDRHSLFLGLTWLLVASSAQGQDRLSVASILGDYGVADVVPSLDHSGSLPKAPIPERVEVGSSSDSLFALRKRDRRYRVDGGYEFGWLQPRFSDNVSVVVSRPSGDQAYAFDHQFEITSRLWVGIENDRCAGIRARYWDLNTDAPKQVTFALAGAAPLSLTIEGGGGNLSRTAVANAGEVMTSTHHLEMRTIDLEGTQRINFACTQTIASFGLRYAQTQQRSHAVATNGAGAVSELVCQDLDFEGFGPTTSIEMTRGMFAANSILCRLSFYANARGSILFGQQQQQIVLVTGGGASLAEDEYVHDSLLPIAELVGGLQWVGQPLGRGRWTIRTGYRAESWFGAGGPINTSSNLGLHGMVLSIAARW